MRVKVTEERILENGHSPYGCPIYRAIVAADPTLEDQVAVFSGYIIVSRGYNTTRIQLPQEVSKWIARYDYWESIYKKEIPSVVGPIEFDLEVPNFE